MEILLKRMFLVFFIIGLSFNTESQNIKLYNENNIEMLKRINSFELEHQYKILYNEAIKQLKEFEGLRLETYYCLAEQKTIGYGHAIQKNEQFTIITEQQADTLLKQDLNKCIKAVLNSTDLHKFEDAAKVIALSLFVYNCGIGNFNKSTLRTLVNEDKSIDDEIIKWTYVKTKRGYVYSTHLLKRRKFEMNIYNT